MRVSLRGWRSSATLTTTTARLNAPIKCVEMSAMINEQQYFHLRRQHETRFAEKLAKAKATWHFFHSAVRASAADACCGCAWFRVCLSVCLSCSFCIQTRRHNRTVSSPACRPHSVSSPVGVPEASHGVEDPNTSVRQILTEPGWAIANNPQDLGRLPEAQETWNTDFSSFEDVFFVTDATDIKKHVAAKRLSLQLATSSAKRHSVESLGSVLSTLVNMKRQHCVIFGK